MYTIDFLTYLGEVGEVDSEGSVVVASVMIEPLRCKEESTKGNVGGVHSLIEYNDRVGD